MLYFINYQKVVDNRFVYCYISSIMDYKSKYTPEEVKEKLDYIKSNIGTDANITYTTGIKYNIWMVYNGYMETEDAC